MNSDTVLIYYAAFIGVTIIINICIYIHVKHQIDKSSNEDIKKVKEELLKKKKGKHHEGASGDCKKHLYYRHQL